MDAYRSSVASRIVEVGQVWPGITPANVHDLALNEWFAVAASLDAIRSERSKR